MKIKIIILTILIILSITSCKEKSKAHKYKIGDKGPAGGLIFYDKGKFSEDWRYLEAAPLDEGDFQWGAYGTDVAGTLTGIGTGKANTQVITAILSQLGETVMAAQICEDKIYNGFSDWFLPSRDELNEMYNDLQTRELGGFLSSSYYWSSSQYDNDGTWGQNFTDGDQTYVNFKDLANRVRAIRAF